MIKRIGFFEFTEIFFVVSILAIFVLWLLGCNTLPQPIKQPCEPFACGYQLQYCMGGPKRQPVVVMHYFQGTSMIEFDPYLIIACREYDVEGFIDSHGHDVGDGDVDLRDVAVLFRSE